MTQAKLTFSLLVLVFTSVVSAREYGIHFDDAGNIIKPDQEYLWRGIDDENDGFRNSALKNFKKAAEFGNYHAMSLVALYHMQDKDYQSAHAWFKLIDLGKIPNRAYLEETVNNLEEVMTPKELKKGKELRAKLSETYGSYPTLLRREKWKKSMEFTGTRIKGHIPPYLKITLNSGMQVTGNHIKRQVENFIYDYEFDFGQGEVVLDEIKLIEVNDSE